MPRLDPNILFQGMSGLSQALGQRVEEDRKMKMWEQQQQYMENLRIEAEERAEERTIEAEKRANEEWINRADITLEQNVELQDRKNELDAELELHYNNPFLQKFYDFIQTPEAPPEAHETLEGIERLKALDAQMQPYGQEELAFIGTLPPQIGVTFYEREQKKSIFMKDLEYKMKVLEDREKYYGSMAGYRGAQEAKITKETELLGGKKLMELDKKISDAKKKVVDAKSTRLYKQGVGWEKADLEKYKKGKASHYQAYESVKSLIESLESQIQTLEEFRSAFAGEEETGEVTPEKYLKSLPPNHQKQIKALIKNQGMSLEDALAFYEQNKSKLQ